VNAQGKRAKPSIIAGRWDRICPIPTQIKGRSEETSPGDPTKKKKEEGSLTLGPRSMLHYY